jgi:hypothetical protein
MSVYVDPLFGYGGSATFRWKTSCHMYADSLEELHAFAKSIGLKRAWFQDKRLPHYDLNEGRHRVAIRKGAKQHTRGEAVEFWRNKGWFPQRSAAVE